MADIELVIKIPETLKDIADKDDIKVFSHLMWQSILIDAIKNGTPPPKGHGRIGDLDVLREEVSSWGMNDYEPSDFTDAIDQADTIIEAESEDKE